LIRLNNKGQSLTSALISIGISAIVILVVMQIIDQQNRSLRFYMRKSELIDQKNYVQNLFNPTQVCDWQFSSLNQTLNVDDTNAEGVLNSTLSLEKIHSGYDDTSPAVAQVGQELGSTKLVVSQIKYENIKASGIPDSYVGDVVISFNQSSGQTAFAPIRITKGIVVNSADPAAAKRVKGCDEGVNDLAPYPTNCNLTFGHRDNGGPIKTMIYPMTKPGFKGIDLAGNVNSDDKFYVGGSCTSAPPGSMEEYVRQCSFDIGIKDNTDNANYATNAYPSNHASHLMNNMSTSQLSMSGDVNADDSFYYRFRCNSPANDNAKYFYNNCYVCFGHSDNYKPTPDTKTCAPITLIGSASWTRFRFTGDVNADDIIYMGFYCRNPSDVVHSLQ
jgi:hypothetical protein